MILQALKEANYSELVPTLRSDTRKSLEWDHWHATEGSEMKPHEQNGTWILVPSQEQEDCQEQMGIRAKA